MKNPGWHPADIKALIQKRGATLTRLAVEAGAEPGACRTAVVRRNGPGEAIISQFLGIPAHELWPDRYHANGVRRDLRRERPLKTITPASKRKTNEPRTCAHRAQTARPCGSVA